MYEEMKEKFIQSGVSQKIIDKYFSMKRYDLIGFPEYVYKRMIKAAPLDENIWLEKSVRFCLKTFSRVNTSVFNHNRKKYNAKRGISIKNTINQKKETEKIKLNRQNFDLLSKEEKQIYITRATIIHPDKPLYLIQWESFLLYCQEMEEKECYE